MINVEKNKNTILEIFNEIRAKESPDFNRVEEFALLLAAQDYYFLFANVFVLA